jgi:hypothetical protein
VRHPKEYEIEVHDIRKLDPQVRDVDVFIRFYICKVQADQPEPTLNDNGYQLVDIPTVVTTEQFTESERSEEGKAYIKDIYFKECKRIIEEVTGGVGSIIPVSFRLREQKGGKESTTEKLGSIESRYAPRPVAHLDRDTPTAITVLEETVGKEEAQKLLSKHKRWAQVNVWRPIGKLNSVTGSMKADQAIVGNPATMWPLCFMNHERIPEWSYDTHVGHVWSLNDPRVADRGNKTYDCVVRHDARYDYHYVSNLKPEVCSPASDRGAWIHGANKCVFF